MLSTTHSYHMPQTLACETAAADAGQQPVSHSVTSSTIASNSPAIQANTSQLVCSTHTSTGHSQVCCRRLVTVDCKGQRHCMSIPIAFKVSPQHLARSTIKLHQSVAMSSHAHAPSIGDAIDAATAPAVSSLGFAEQSTVGISTRQLQGSSNLTPGPQCSIHSYSATERPAPPTAYTQLQHASSMSHFPSQLPTYTLQSSSGLCTSGMTEDTTSTAAAAATTASPSGPAGAATAEYHGNEAMGIAMIDSPAAACPPGSAPGHAATAATAVAADAQEDGSVVINLASLADACTTASNSSAGTQCTCSWAFRPASMQDSLAQHILRAHQAKQHAIEQLESNVTPLGDHQLQEVQQQQQLDIHFKPVLCTPCILKCFLTSLCAPSPAQSKSPCGTPKQSTCRVERQHAENSSSSASMISAAVSCKACWKLQLQQIERHEMFLAAQLPTPCKVQAQKCAMQEARYSAYTFAVPEPLFALCADRYTTWAAFNAQLAQDKAKFEPCYLQYREVYVRLLGRLVAKQGGSLQPYSCLGNLSYKVSSCLALALRSVQERVAAIKQQLCWDSVKQVPGSVLFHVSQLLLLLVQCIYVPLTVVLVPFMWVGREIKTTVEYTAEWLWDVWKAAVQSLVYLFAKGFHCCLD